MNKPRLDSIDFLRGLVMVLMALDHVRDFFYYHVDPTDLTKTTPQLFFTRWVTHFCAPTFLLLAGVGAALSRLRGKTTSELAVFLITRGLWLIFLEWMVVRTFGWAWNFDFTYLPCWVIWTLGWSMIVLGILVRFPAWLSIIFGLTLIVGHHLVDNIKGEQFGSYGWIWHMLHDPTDLIAPQWGMLMKKPADHPMHGLILSAGYPLVPWIGVMAVGYGLGMVYGWDARARRRLLVILGTACCVAFILLRLNNGYGESKPWEAQQSLVFNVMSFLNCTKQPPSLCYLLMTLGPALLLLALFDAGVPGWLHPMVIFGKVPMFYYLLHLPIIHGLWVLAALWSFGEFPFWLFSNPPLDSVPAQYGYSLQVVYVLWLFVLALLYPLCSWYARVKQRNKSVWLSYL